MRPCRSPTSGRRWPDDGRPGKSLARVVLARRAHADVLALEWRIAEAVIDALGVLERDPEAGHALRGRLRGLRSLRVGTYRVIYQVVDDGKTVRVAAVRHRAVAYAADPR